MFRKLKIDFKKCMACLLATLQIQAMSGCMGTSKNADKSTEPENITESLQIENQKLKDIINQKNSNIVDLQKENEDLKAQISSLQDGDKKLEGTINKDNNESELNQESTEEYIRKAFESASERSEHIRTSEDPNVMIYKTYAYVSDEYKNLNGKRYVWVKVNNNDQYVGLFNLETLNEDIPCNTFDVINDEFQTTGTYRWLSVPDDNDYKCGLYDTTNSNLIIPCKTYTEINYYEESGIYQCIKPDGTADIIQLPFNDYKDAEEYVRKAFESASERSEQIRTSEDPNLMLYKTYAYVSEEYKNLNGKRYVWVKVNSDDQYKGLFNLETLNEDIPCNTFDKIKDEFQAYNTGTYRWISIPGDSGYICGLYDTTNSNLIIPCKTYTDYTYYEESGIYQCIKPDGTADSVQLPFVEDTYKIENLFTYERTLDSQASYKPFYGNSFFITAKFENDLDSYVYGNRIHTHCIGGTFWYNYGKPFYSSDEFFKGNIGEDVILFLNEDNKPKSALCLDAMFQDNYAYNTTTQQYADCICGLIYDIDPISGMSFKEYLETHGLQDLIKDEYRTSELVEIKNYIEENIVSKNLK